MSNNHHDFAEFLERRLADRGDCDNNPEQEILNALIEWIEAGCPAPRISVVFDANGCWLTVDKLRGHSRAMGNGYRRRPRRPIRVA